MGRSAERVASDYLSSMGDWRFEAPLPPCDPVVHALRQELVAHNGLPGCGTYIVLKIVPIDSFGVQASADLV
jgi:hypothetical protein